MMRTVMIDCAAIHSREEFHAAMKTALELPSWYGGNLDALHDLLAAMPDTSLTLKNWSRAELSLGRYALAARNAMSHAARENPRLRLTFSH